MFLPLLALGDVADGCGNALASVGSKFRDEKYPLPGWECCAGPEIPKNGFTVPIALAEQLRQYLILKSLPIGLMYIIQNHAGTYRLLLIKPDHLPTFRIDVFGPAVK